VALSRSRNSLSLRVVSGKTIFEVRASSSSRVSERPHAWLAVRLCGFGGDSAL